MCDLRVVTEQGRRGTALDLSKGVILANPDLPARRGTSAAAELADVLAQLDQAEGAGDPLELLRLRVLVGRLHQLERKKDVR